MITKVTFLLGNAERCVQRSCGSWRLAIGDWRLAIGRSFGAIALLPYCLIAACCGFYVVAQRAGSSVDSTNTEIDKKV